MIVLINAAALVIGVLLGGLILWLCARLVRVANVGYGRALGTWVLVNLIAFLIGALPVILPPQRLGRSRSEDETLLWGLIQLILFISVLPFVVRWMLRTGFWRSASILWVSIFLSSVIAFATAIGVRAKIVEAFVVPTGGMAPTVLGMHHDVDCPNCSYTLSVSTSPLLGFSKRAAKINCPNCAHTLEYKREGAGYDADRILVDKTVLPKRWGVAVFRNPGELDHTFIMRIVAMPGESVELIDGEVFVNGHLSQKPPGRARDLWVPVHDSSFVPTEVDEKTSRWRADTESSRWTHDQKRWVYHAGDADDRLTFTGDVSNRSAYNLEQERAGDVIRPVADVKITCSIDQLAGPGDFRISYSFADTHVTAGVNASNSVRLLVNDKEAAGQTGAFRDLALAVRDGQAYVLADGKVIVSHGLADRTVDESRGHASARSGSPHRPQLALIAGNCDVTLGRIMVHRDVHYLDRAPYGRGAGRGRQTVSTW